jgi:hypothetical protein
MTWVIAVYVLAVIACIVNDNNDDGGTGGNPLFTDA